MASGSKSETLEELVKNVADVKLPIEGFDDLGGRWEGLTLGDFDRLSVSLGFITSAKESAEHALTAGMRMNRVRKLSAGKQPIGQWKSAEQDLLRSSLVFAGAGLDASLKQLIRDWLPRSVDSASSAQIAFERFAERHIADRDEIVDRAALVKLFISETPKQFLLGLYEKELTSGSLQSVEKVKEVAVALGVLDDGLVKRLQPGKELDLAFKARNQVVHELDLLHPSETTDLVGSKPRRVRTMPKVQEMVVEILSVAHTIIAEAGAQAVPTS